MGGLPALPSRFATGWKKGRLYIVGVIANVPGGTCYFPSEHCTGLVTSACPCESSYKSSIRISKTQKL